MSPFRWMGSIALVVGVLCWSLDDAAESAITPAPAPGITLDRATASRPMAPAAPSVGRAAPEREPEPTETDRWLVDAETGSAEHFDPRSGEDPTVIPMDPELERSQRRAEVARDSREQLDEIATEQGFSPDELAWMLDQLPELSQDRNDGHL